MSQTPTIAAEATAPHIDPNAATAGSESDDPARPHSRQQRRPWPPIARAALPGALYVLVRGAGLGLLAMMVSINHKTLNLQAWDGGWYLAIAQHGYLGVPTSATDMFGHHTAYTAMVFFPGYPQLVRWTAPLLAHNYLAAAITISCIAGVAGAYGVARLAGRHYRSPRTTALAVILFAAAPMAAVYVMAYPEALLSACTAWALVGVVERRWWLAAVCTVIAGYTSPMAAPLIAAVMIVAFVDVVKGRSGWDAAGAVLVVPAGMLGYLLWVGQQTGRGDGYFAAQKAGWGSGWDGGWSMIRWLWQTSAGDTSAYTVIAAWLVLAAVVAVVAWRRRMPWQVWLFTLLTVLFAVGAAGIQWDKTRLLLEAFPLVLPAAGVLARYRLPKLITIGAVVVGFGLWFSAYALAVWPYSI